MDRNETTILQELPQKHNQQHRVNVDSQNEFRRDGETNPNTQAVPSARKAGGRIALLGFALLAGIASAV